MMEIQYFDPQEADLDLFQTIISSGSVPVEHFHTGIVVREDGQALAKAVLYINPQLVYQHYKVGLVGAYAAMEHIGACQLLFGTLSDIASSLGLDMLLGPMNGSTWEDYRFADYSDRAPFLMEKVHPPYYSEQWERCGFETIARYYSSESYQLQVADPTIAANALRLQDEGVRIRPLDLEDYESELRHIYPFLTQAFSNNLLYSPIAESIFIEKYLPLKHYLQADFVLIAEHGDKVVGVFLCIADALDAKNRTLIIKTIARDSASLYRGLGHVMAAQVYKQAHQQQFNRIVHAFLKEEGTSTPISQHFHGVPFQTYSLYGKVL